MTTLRIGAWTREAALRTGRRDIGFALAIGAVPILFGLHGGALLTTMLEGVNPLLDPSKHFIKGFIEDVFTIGLPMVLSVKVANRAIADGVPRWLAYGAALLVVGVVRHLYNLTPLSRNEGEPHLPAEIVWYYMAIFLEGGIGLVIYARWHASQESMRLVQANETQRARTAQRLQSARLLALQARVDPQLLFDSLGRVGVLQRNDPAAAEALLSDLIAMLRAMLPGETTLTSTVEREFALIDAWLRVTGAVASARADVTVQASSEARPSRLAPLLALPLLRAVLDVPGARAVPWRLEAVTAGGRLLITLGAAPQPAERGAELLARADFEPLRERLATLHGDAARLWLAQPAMATLDVPFVLDDGDEPADEAAAPALAPSPKRQEAAA